MQRIIEFHGAKGGQGTSTVAIAAAMIRSKMGAVEIVAAAGDDLYSIAGVPLNRDELAPNVMAVDAPTGNADYVIYDNAEAGSDQLYVTRILVVRGPCYLALHNAVHRSNTLHFDGFVLVQEQERALSEKDAELALGMKCLAVIPVTPRVARAIDAGVLTHRLGKEFANLESLMGGVQV